MPEVCIVVEGASAQGQVFLPGVVQYTLDSDVGKRRNQHAIRISEKDLLDPATATACIEATIQQVGGIRHIGFAENERESLDRLAPDRVAAKADTVAQEGTETEELQNQAVREAQLAEIQKKSEVLGPSLEQENAARNEAAQMPARAYALKYALPALHRAMCMAGRIRPDDGVDFVSNFLMHYEELKDSLPEPGKINLPDIG